LSSFSSSSTFKPFVIWQHSNGTRALEKKQLMTMMMREERCASDDLLLEGKEKKPSNHLQRLGFDCSEETRVS
jgi:hypothetical protein